MTSYDEATSGASGNAVKVASTTLVHIPVSKSGFAAAATALQWCIDAAAKSKDDREADGTVASGFTHQRMTVVLQTDADTTQQCASTSTTVTSDGSTATATDTATSSAEQCSAQVQEQREGLMFVATLLTQVQDVLSNSDTKNIEQDSKFCDFQCTILLQKVNDSNC